MPSSDTQFKPGHEKTPGSGRPKGAVSQHTKNLNRLKTDMSESLVLLSPYILKILESQAKSPYDYQLFMNNIIRLAGWLARHTPAAPVEADDDPGPEVVPMVLPDTPIPVVDHRPLSALTMDELITKYLTYDNIKPNILPDQPQKTDPTS